MESNCIVTIAPSAIRAAEENQTGNLYLECSKVNGRSHYTLKDAGANSVPLAMRNSFHSFFGLEKHIFGADLENILTQASAKPTGPAAGRSVTEMLSRNKELQVFTDYLQLGKKDPLSTGKTKLRRGMKKLFSLREGIVQAKAKGLEPVSMDIERGIELFHDDHFMSSTLDKAREAWLESEGIIPFETWLKAHPEFGNKNVQVKYLNAAERKKYETTFQNGKLVRNNQPYGTQNESTHFSGKGVAIFVLGLDKKLYTGSHIMGQFHHSSFLSGKPVLSAGEIQSDRNGKILKVNNKSGHYKPSLEQNLTILKTLAENGVDLRSVEYEIISPKGIICTYNAQAYLDANGKLLPYKISQPNRAEVTVLQDPSGKVTLRENQLTPIVGRERDILHYEILNALQKHDVDLKKVSFFTASGFEINLCMKYFLDLEQKVLFPLSSFLFS